MARPRKNTVKAAEVKTAETKVADVTTVETEAAAAVEETKTEKKAVRTVKKAEKEELKPEIVLEYGDQTSVVEEVVDKVKAAYVAAGHRVSSIKSLKVYLKPADKKAYYVINDKLAGDVELF